MSTKKNSSGKGAGPSKDSSSKDAAENISFDDIAVDEPADETSLLVAELDKDIDDDDDAPSGDEPKTGLVSDVTPLTQGSATWLVSNRESSALGRGKLFLLSSAFLILAVIGSMVFWAIDSNKADTPTIAVVGEQDVAAIEQAYGFKVVTAKTDKAASDLVQKGDVDAAILLDQATGSPKVVALNDEPTEITDKLVQKPEVTLLQPTSASSGLTNSIAIGFALLFAVSVLALGWALARNLIEEKRHRIGEITVTAIRPNAVTRGKLFGVGLLALAQVAAVGLLALVGLSIGGQQAVLTFLTPAVAYYAGFFLLGFVIFSSLWLAVGSIVNRKPRNIWTVIVGALAVVSAFGPLLLMKQEAVFRVLSFIPFTAPTAMPMRVFNKQTEVWEPLAALGIALVVALIVAAICGSAYGRTLLRGANNKSLKRKKSSDDVVDEGDDHAADSESKDAKSKKAVSGKAATDDDADDDLETGKAADDDADASDDDAETEDADLADIDEGSAGKSGAKSSTGATSGKTSATATSSGKTSAAGASPAGKTSNKRKPGSKPRRK
ncbi:ABC transporter permease [Saxibacter everestensis]|uniref:ABC transporter permease n=1 Tax=Saxibacter everestensis TaxID=2909229 RepID=A0ABY8QT79_9MICO|nr:ABC transporter permease [Brevibacteriaceae bacterium ZFBP1038]